MRSGVVICFQFFPLGLADPTLFHRYYQYHKL